MKHPVWRGYNDIRQHKGLKFQGMMEFFASPDYDKMKALIGQQACDRYIQRMFSEEND